MKTMRKGWILVAKGCQAPLTKRMAAWEEVEDAVARAMKDGFSEDKLAVLEFENGDDAKAANF